MDAVRCRVLAQLDEKWKYVAGAYFQTAPFYYCRLDVINADSV